MSEVAVATILIVDDRSSNRQFLTTLLGYGGHRLLEAVNGVEALNVMREERPDLVITDILMPTMDGFEFVQQLRADPALRHTPVIFHTATYNEPEAQKLAASCGVRTVLPKPCEPQQVIDAVERELGPQPAARGSAAPRPKRPKRRGHRDVLPDVDDTLSLRFKDLQAAQRKVERSLERKSRSERDEGLWRDYSGNVAGLQRLASRLSALLEVALEMMQERDPTRLVKLFFGAACEMIESEYTALCILGEAPQLPPHVLARNFDPALYRDAGAARGGLPGSLLGERRTLRAHGAGIAASADGLPAGHPAVRSFLGVAIATRDQVYGWLYFADRRGAEAFSEEDERVAAILAAKLALLYENTQLYDVIQRHAAKLQVESAERIQAQHALHEREAGLRRAQVMARLAHAITRPDGSFESWSESLPGLAGVEPSRMPRSTREWLVLVHADDQALFRETAIDAGAKTAHKDLEYRLRRADGSMVNIRHVMEPIEGSADSHGGMRWFNTVQDVTHQKRAQETLRESELRFRQIAENIREVFFLIDPANSQMLYISPAYEQIWQRSVASLYANPQSWTDSILAEDRERVFATFQDQQRHGRFDYEYRISRSDGTLRWIHTRGLPIRDEAGRLIRIAGIAEDITDRKAAEDKVRGLNRVYAVLSGINTLIVRVRNRDELFREACRIAVEAGQFRLAWIGMVDREARRVVPVAWAGDDRGFLEQMPSGTDDPTASGGMVAQAIAERRPVISEDMARDPRIVLKDEAAARGFHALALLPLIVSGEAQGVLALYAAEIGFFDEEEMKLLNELAGDIAFAIEHLEAVGRAEYLAFHDPLTDLPNRAVLVDHLDLMIRTARREQRLAGVVFFDIERLRHVNETLGRQAGDQVLKQVAERMRHATRAGDTPARVGGDAFAMAVSGFSSIKEATHMLTERMTRALLPPMVIDGRELRVVLKAGAAVYPSDGDSAETLCANAEAALKNAKETGERYVFYTPEINARVAESLAMENRLRVALEAGQFVLHYQPKVDTRTRAIIGLEALIRWNDPELGLVQPGKFIPLMEETGLILESGRWALGRAVADVQAWRSRGLAAPRVAVNVSQIQLRQKDFVHTVLQALEGFGDAEPVLDLEITESMVMQNLDATVQALQALRGAGVETSLDDFGTGYSSLAYVARLPVVALKIDRSFIVEMTFSRYARTIVQTVISLAHSLGLKVIAEGVDHEDQVAILAALGCDQMQGYLISKPVPPEQIEALLARA